MALLTAPGLWLQRITTKPPDDAQAAVAIHALEGAMALEAEAGRRAGHRLNRTPCNISKSSTRSSAASTS